MDPGARLFPQWQSSPNNPGEKHMSVSDETATTTDGIILSDAAAAKVKSLLEQEGRDDLALRVAVQPGGCSGLRYQLFFDERSLDGDVVKDFDGVKVVTDRMSAPYLGGASIDFKYEPSREALLRALLPRHVAMQVWRALLESAASEHGARMSAMESATKNAEEMISSLTLQYNRARQAYVTKELMEIVSGAEALK